MSRTYFWTVVFLFPSHLIVFIWSNDWTAQRCNVVFFFFFYFEILVVFIFCLDAELIDFQKNHFQFCCLIMLKWENLDLFCLTCLSATGAFLCFCISRDYCILYPPPPLTSDVWLASCTLISHITHIFNWNAFYEWYKHTVHCVSWRNL